MSGKRKTLFVLLAVFFFLLPFSWSQLKSLNIGGDDTRLYYYSPIDWVRHISLYSWYSNSSFPVNAPQVHTLPLLSFLSLFQAVGVPAYVIQKGAFGAILFFSFLAVYLLLKEIFREIGGKNERFLPAVIGGFIYATSPFIYLMEWPRPLYQIFALPLFPFLFYFYLTSIHTGKIAYLLYGGFLSVFLALGLFSIPWSAAFFIHVLFFVLVYFFLCDQPVRRRVIPYLLLYGGIIILFTMFFLLPFSSNYWNSPQLFTITRSEIKESTSDSIVNLASRMDILYTLSNLPSRRFYFTPHPDATLVYLTSIVVYVSFVLPVSIAAAMILRRRGKETTYLLSFLSAMLLALFCITINIGQYGMDFFVWLMKHVPGWVMFRNFYSKFAITFEFFYAVTVALSLSIVLSRLKRGKTRTLLLGFLGWSLLLQSWPFFNGSSMNKPTYPDIPYSYNVQVPTYYQEAMRYLAQIPEDGKVLSLPLTKPQYGIFTGSDRKGAYTGNSPIKALAGKDNFSGINSFYTPLLPGLPEVIQTVMNEQDGDRLKKILGWLNVRFIVYNADFPDSIAKYFMWKPERFTKEQQIRKWLRETFGNELQTFGPLSVFLLPRDAFIPHLSIPDLVKTEESVETFTKHIRDNLGESIGVVIEEQQSGKSVPPLRLSAPPSLTFERIAPTIYAVSIRNATEAFPLVFLEPFHPGWQAHIVPAQNAGCTEVKKFSPANVQVHCPGRTIFTGMLSRNKKTIEENNHLIMDGYANGWVVNPPAKDFDLIIEYMPQRLVWIGGAITIISIIVSAGYLVRTALRRSHQSFIESSV